MPLAYEQNLKVQQFECDCWDNMTPGSILRRVQEISTEQCEQYGLNDAYYKKTHTVFLLSRLSLQINRIPKTSQTIRIQTRAYGLHRALYHRLTSFFDEEGHLLCETDARWVLVNTDTRHILRKEPEGFISPFTDVPAEEHEMTIQKVHDAVEVAQRVASYSLCDRNGHINNCNYADIVCDLLPIAQLKEKPIKKMLLFYKDEIPMGESFSLFEKAIDDNTFYYAGKQNGRTSFESCVYFK